MGIVDMYSCHEDEDVPSGQKRQLVSSSLSTLNENIGSKKETFHSCVGC